MDFPDFHTHELKINLFFLELIAQSQILCYSTRKQSRLGEQGYNHTCFVGWKLLLYMAPGQEVGTRALFFSPSDCFAITLEHLVEKLYSLLTLTGKQITL